ncbi:MAG: PilN domain-containing protein [Candidatus Omnitrophica bacterium]|nr:PilN domain-containing protein [Candidatus Omnitrophota bacterium]
MGRAVNLLRQLWAFMRAEGPIAGIVMGPEHVFKCTVRREEGGRMIWGERSEAPLPKDSVVNGHIMDPAAVAQVLGQMFPGRGYAVRRVAIALNVPGLLSRTSDLAPMVGEKLKKALKAEADKYLHGEAAVLDLFHLDRARVSWVAVPHAAAQAYAAMARAAGLDLVSLDASALAALRALSEDVLPARSKDTVMVILASGSQAEIVLFKEGLPVLRRSLSSTQGSDIIQEATLTRAYWEEETRGEAIAKAVILDDHNESASWAEGLQEALGGIPVERAGVLGTRFDSYNLSWAVAAGLALRGAVTRAFDLNLIPPEKAAVDRRLRYALASGVYLVAVCVAFLGVGLTLSASARSWQVRTLALAGQMGGSQDVVQEWGRLNAERGQLKRALEEMGRLAGEGSSPAWSEIIRDLAKKIPAQVWLERVEPVAGEEALCLIGKAYAQEDVYQYVRLLGVSPFFVEPTLDRTEGTSREGMQAVRFIITCPVRALLERAR